MPINVQTISTAARALRIAILLILCPLHYVSSSSAQVMNIPPIVDAAGSIVPGSIASLEKVSLGGVDQWVLIRSYDKTKPVLLILHGGPGGTQMPWVDLFQPTALEENFIVVHWDQRGAGKSFDPNLSVDELQVKEFVADVLELTDLLRERFNQEKIFLTGHSWGSALGFFTLIENSKPFHAFIPTSERVQWKRSFEISLEWIKTQATAANDTKVLARIDAIQPFDSSNPEHLSLVFEGQEIYRGGDIYTEGLWDKYLEYVINGQSPYYTMDDVGQYIPGLEKSEAALMDSVIKYDLFTSFLVANIPVHFIMAEHDHNTSVALAREYYELLDAPRKSFTMIEGAGHSFMYEKPEEWAESLIRIANETLRN